MLRSLYRFLGWTVTAKAASRGPGALGRNVVRRKAHKSLAKTMRGFKL